MNRWRRQDVDEHEAPWVKAMARQLGIPRLHAFGCLGAARDYHAKHADPATGLLAGATLDDLDDAAQLAGFAAAAAAAGEIIESPEGIRLRSWETSIGPEARDRALAADRQRRKRSRDRHGESVTAVTVASRGERDHDTRRNDTERDVTDALTGSPSPVRNSSALTDERGAKKRAKTDGERMSAEDQQAAAKWRERLAQVDLSDSTARKAAEVLGVTLKAIDGLIGEYGEERVKSVCLWVRDRAIDPDHPPVPNPGGLVMSTLANASRPSEITPAGQFKRLVKGRAADNANARAVDRAIRPSRRRLDEADADAPHECGAILHHNGRARPP